MSRPKLTIEFSSEELRDEFVYWFWMGGDVSLDIDRLHFGKSQDSTTRMLVEVIQQEGSVASIQVLAHTSRYAIDLAARLLSLAADMGYPACRVRQGAVRIGDMLVVFRSTHAEERGYDLTFVDHHAGGSWRP